MDELSNEPALSSRDVWKWRTFGFSAAATALLLTVVVLSFLSTAAFGDSESAQAFLVKLPAGIATLLAFFRVRGRALMAYPDSELGNLAALQVLSGLLSLGLVVTPFIVA